MDDKMFWLIGLALIGIIGSLLVFARRFNNHDDEAGLTISALTVFMMIIWIIFGR